METRALALLAGMELPAGEVARWIAAAKAGDLCAFERLMLRYQRQVMMTALRMLGQRADAQDAAQEVFFRLFRHIGRVREENDLSPWLYRVTMNVCRDALRRRGRFEALDEDLSEPQPDAAVEREHREILQRGLRRLAPKEREALVLRDIEGLSPREIGGILGTSEATVRVQVSRARVKLRDFCARFRGRSV